MAPFFKTDCCLDVFPSVLPAALFPVSQELTCTEDMGVMCCNSFVHPREASRGSTKKNRNIHSLYPPSWKVRPTLLEKTRLQGTIFLCPIYHTVACLVRGRLFPPSTTVNMWKGNANAVAFLRHCPCPWPWPLWVFLPRLKSHIRNFIQSSLFYRYFFFEIQGSLAVFIFFRNAHIFRKCWAFIQHGASFMSRRHAIIELNPKLQRCRLFS